MKKVLYCLLIFTIASVLVLPTAITYLYQVKQPVQEQSIVITGIDNDVAVDQIKVLNPETEEIVQTPLEDYIIGVVGAEMPALFELEAMKAQAVAARTYAVRQMKEQNQSIDSDVPYEIGQAYLTKDQLKQKWGIEFEKYYDKVSQAVEQTKGEILVYEQEPILAVFHSTSAGITEDAENVWGTAVPYLKSVDSKEDEKAPNYEVETELSANWVIGKLQEQYPDLILAQGNLLAQIQIIERTQAGYVKQIQIGNKIMTGRQVREILGLRSSDFSIRQEGDKLIFTTKGYGHGAGMSQYGANFMAQEGYTYDQILEHYYQGAAIEKLK